MSHAYGIVIIDFASRIMNSSVCGSSKTRNFVYQRHAFILNFQGNIFWIIFCRVTFRNSTYFMVNSLLFCRYFPGRWGGGSLESWDVGDVPPSILGEDP